MSDPSSAYSYGSSLKSARSDELINTYVERPIAGLLVRLLYRTPVTPNQVTVAATVAGLAASWLYLRNLPVTTAVAGCLLWLKDILDSADGQLARAKGMYSRAGRFLDSIGDLVVNAAVFFAISAVLANRNDSVGYLILGVLCFLGTTLRVSYHVFYQVSYLHLHDHFELNRTSEEIRADDHLALGMTLGLQILYQALYGWQDRLMAGVDRWSGRPRTNVAAAQWYADRTGLVLSGFLGMGTELIVLVVFSLLNRLEGYMFINLLAQNGIWITCILYRRVILRRLVKGGGGENAGHFL